MQLRQCSGPAARIPSALASAKESVALAFDETWGYTHMDSDSDIGVVCDWTGVSSGVDVPTCAKGTCSGHNADDKLPFDLSAVSSKLSKATTNQEFYNWLSPTNPDLPYVYDSFKYEHCMQSGVDIGGSNQESSDNTPPTSGPDATPETFTVATGAGM